MWYIYLHPVSNKFFGFCDAYNLKTPEFDSDIEVKAAVDVSNYTPVPEGRAILQGCQLKGSF